MAKRIPLFLPIFLLLSWLPHRGHSKSKELPLKIGLLYSGDSFAVAYAQDSGLFQQNGVAVELVPFTSAFERDNALLAGQIDGANGDLIGASLLHAREEKIQITTLLLGDDPTLRLCGIVVSDPSKYKSPQDLRGKTIAISPHTTIEYLSDRILEANGVPPGTLINTHIQNIHLRMSLLQQKKLDAALLPEPLASMAVVQGGKILLDNRTLPYAHAVLLFRKESIQNRTDQVQRFHTAMWAGIRMMNQNPQAHREAIAVRSRVPDAVKEPGFLYRFAEAQLPSLPLYKDVQNWLKEKKKIPTPIPYESLMNPRFLPKRAHAL
jgi:NitT/TauT family transport system substrate-binding protein